MTTTIEEFKKAFSTSSPSPEDLVKQFDRRVSAALKLLKELVDAQEQTGSGRGARTELVTVVKRFDRAKKRDGSPQEVAAELEEIRQATLVMISELQQAPDSSPAASQLAPAARGSETSKQRPPDLRRHFRTARLGWVKVRDQAIQDLEAVKDGICNHYLDDPDQLPVVLDRLGDLDEIMDNLSDDLRDVLDAYVGTRLDDRRRLEELAEEARQTLTTFQDYLSKSELLAAVDQKEFANVTIKAPMESALRKLAAAIA